jgi:hypothetical protein
VIIYDLKCDKGHKFEGWFHDRKAFEEQKMQKLISCPVCGSVNNEVLPSSVTVMCRDNKMEVSKEKELATIKAHNIIKAYLDENFDDVGDEFSDVALRIHNGEEEERNIKGTATKDEEDMLMKEGIHFIKIPVPKLDS